ncbi:MAG: hypothetical protein PHQ52_04985 [Candidatus Omnitrophica bacterium]|nr:hypothetical protein [Candidatus Omnitrophota bacterium]
MKQYLTAKISVIKLDQKQALINVCAVGGLYVGMGGGTNWCGHTTGAEGLGPVCWDTPKGGDAPTVLTLHPTSLGGDAAISVTPS